MKVFRKVLIGFLSLFMLFTASMAIACQSNEPSAPSGFTVTFMVQGSQYGNQQTVQKGRRVVEPQAPTFSEPGYVFTGWFTTENFEEGTMWNFTTGMVVSDLTLYAGYRIVNEHVTEVAKANEAVSSKLVWTQSALSNATDYVVIIANAKGETTTLTGTVSYDEENYQVLFTPSVIPQGGIYSVSVQDTTKSAEACVVQNVMFNGAGTETNPYLIASEIDFDAVNKQNVAQGTYFSLAKNIAITTNRDSQKSYEFNGIFNGNGRTITISGNSGAIYKVGTYGVVKHVGVAGVISTSLYDSIGALVDFNAGRVEKINTTANVESTAGMVGTSGIQKALDETLEDGSGNRGIAGGIVGTNLTTGVVYNCKIATSSSSTGTIKARIGGGTIVGYNKGSIELCASEGCVGAWNSNETGKSTSNYSYIGGIAGINAGTITKSSLSGSGKILAQRIKEGQIVEGTTNANVGGIAGYNMSGA
ncbi:MAG: InlB B-repeat-containing protein, partial [Clostridia bacterium]|nr:InlB B-repeat-containing protein [Clostridia bacterium]